MPYQGRAVALKNYAPVLQSYFMVRQVQEYYAGQRPLEIKYDCGGKLLTASEMLRGRHTPSNRIYTKWPTGLETWVNRGAEGNWTVIADGTEYVIPPDGHVAVVPDELLQYTALRDGRVVSYSCGKHYTYVDGRGEAVEFPELTAAYSYVVRTENGATRLTPAPFVAPETLKGLGFTEAQPLAQDGKAAGPVVKLDVTDAGKADLPVTGQAFSYLLK